MKRGGWRYDIVHNGARPAGGEGGRRGGRARAGAKQDGKQSERQTAGQRRLRLGPSKQETASGGPTWPRGGNQKQRKTEEDVVGQHKRRSEGERTGYEKCHGYHQRLRKVETRCKNLVVNKKVRGRRVKAEEEDNTNMAQSN